MTRTRENCPNGTTPEIADTERGTIFGIKTKVQQQALGRDKPVGWSLVAHACTLTKGIKDRVTLKCAGLGHAKREKMERRKNKSPKMGLACSLVRSYKDAPAPWRWWSKKEEGRRNEE